MSGIFDRKSIYAGLSPSKKTDEPVPDDPPAEPAVAPAAPIRQVTKKELTTEDRIGSLLADIEGKAPPQIAEYIQKATPFLIPLINFSIAVLNIVGPLYIKAGVLIYKFLDSLPIELYRACLGLGLCFFGGSYCASIAAAEAFYSIGWPTTKRHLEDVYESALQVYEQHLLDEKSDKDGDGIADVKQLKTNELFDRKVKMAAAAVQDPQKLSAAIGGLWTGWLAVQGVLRVKFARTVSLAVSCSQFVEIQLCKLLVPIGAAFVSKEFVHWLPVALNTATKVFFVFWAWKLQELVSAVQSGLRGGLMFSRGLLNFANNRGLKSVYGISLEHEHTYLDELVGYAIAVCGIFFQWHYGFSMPFPFNIVMLPLDALEWYVRWTVSTGGSQAAI